MKKDITNLTRELFKNKKLFISIGFSKQESEIFHLLIQGFSIAKIAVELNISSRKVSYIKNKRFHLIPIFIQRKLNFLLRFDIIEINARLVELNSFLHNYIAFFKSSQNLEISNLNLSKRTINSLKAFNIKTTEDLIAYSSRELLQGKNIGNKTILEIQAELNKLNLKLKN